MTLSTTFSKVFYAFALLLFVALYAPNRIAAQSDLIFSNFTFPKTTVEQAGRFEYAYDFINNGTTDINYGSVGAKLYLSKDKILSADDAQVSDISIGTVPVGGGATQRFNSFSVPIDFTLGTYYLIIKVEGDGTPANNTITAPQIITVTPPAGQFLVISNVTGATTAKPGDVITLNVTVKNQGLSASSGVNLIQYLQEDKSYAARPLSFDKFVLPAIAPNEERTFAVNFKLRDTLYAPNATFVTSNSGYVGYSFGNYFVTIVQNNIANYGCFVSGSRDCTSKKYNITPIYPKANVTVNMTVSKTLLQLDEKFSATYTVTNNGGSTVHDLFVNLGSFTNENRNYSPTSYSSIYNQEVADANTKLITAFGESNNHGWEIFDLKVGETRKITLNFTQPFKEQYASYGAYNPTPLSNFVSVYRPTINKNSSFENTAPIITEQPPFKVVLDISNIADIELSNLSIANPTVQENGILNFKFDLKNLGNKAVTQNFAINSYLYKDKEGIEMIALQDGIINTGNIGAKATVIGVMGALTAKVPPGQYYLRVDAFQFSTPLAELLKSNNVLVSTIPITVTGNTNICKGDLFLDTQAKVNAFNRACTTWDGSISISESVTDLMPLSNLNTVTGGFTIVSANQLTNVQGLNNLQKTGIFVINSNANITSLAALSKLNSVSTTFILSTMPKLTELGLQTITLNNVAHAEVFDLPNLKNTGNFLLKTPYLIEILVKGGMTNIDFLKGIPSIGLLQLTECPNLSNVNGLSQTTTFDKLIIATNKILSNLDGLTQTTKVNQVLTIADNPALKSCCGVVNILKNSSPTTLNILNNLSGCNSKADILATCSASAAISDLTLANLTLTQTNVEKGKVLSYKFDLKNIGNANATSNFSVKSYLSKDNTLSADDVQDGNIQTGNINAGATVAQINGALTANIAAGQYYVILKVDADNQVAESNENNNTIVTTQLITVNAPIVGTPKLTIIAVKADKPIPAAPNSFTVEVTFKNGGTSASAPTTVSMQHIVSLPYPGKFCSSVAQHYEPITNDVAVPSLAAGETKTFWLTFKVGSYNPNNNALVILKENQKTTTAAQAPPCEVLQNTIVSTDGIYYNYTTPPIALLPDLTLANLTLSQTSVEKGKVLNYKFDLKNIGNANATTNFFVKSYLSKDNILSADDVQGGTINTGNINAGAMVTQVMGALTANIAAGQYYVILKVDADNQVSESNENNNTIASAQIITVGTATAPPVTTGIPKITLNATNKNIVAKAGETLNIPISIGNYGSGDAIDVIIKSNFSVLACPSLPCQPNYFGTLPTFKIGLVRLNTLKEYLVGLQLPTTIPVGTYSLLLSADEAANIGNGQNTYLFLNLKIETGTATPTPTPSSNTIELTTTPANIAVQQWGWSEFEVTVKNGGTAATNNMEVKIPLPSSDFVYAYERFVPANPAFNTHTGIWNIGNLAVGASKTLKVSMYALKNNAPYKAVVTIVGTNITKTVTFGGNSTPLPIQNVSLNYALSKTLLSTAETFSATYTIKNSSTSTVPQTWVYLGEFDQRNYDPWTVRVATSTGAGVKTQSDTGEKTKYGWEIFDLKAGEVRTVTLNFEAPFKTTFANQNTYNDATAITFPVPKIQEKGIFYDTTPQNVNTYTLKFKSGTPTTTPQTDIAIAIATTNPTYAQYTNLTYKITVTNNGQQAVGGVKTDVNYIENGKLPFVSAKTSVGNYNGHTKIWDIGTLNGGQSVTLDLILFPLVKGEDLGMKATVVPTDAIPQNNIATLTLKNAVSARNETNITAGSGIQNIYPNPAEDILNIDLKNETEGELYITIFDTFGEIVQKTVQRVSKNTPFIQVQVAELPEGMYILRISDITHRTFIRKFVK